MKNGWNSITMPSKLHAENPNEIPGKWTNIKIFKEWSLFEDIYDVQLIYWKNIMYVE